MVVAAITGAGGDEAAVRSGLPEPCAPPTGRSGLGDVHLHRPGASRGRTRPTKAEVAGGDLRALGQARPRRARMISTMMRMMTMVPRPMYMGVSVVVVVR